MSVLLDGWHFIQALGEWLPWVIGGAAVVAAIVLILIDVPPTLKVPAVAAVLVVAAVVFGVIELANYRGEVAAMATYKADQAKAVLAAQQKADALSNELIIAQAASMAVTEKTTVQYVDRIQHDPPSACPPSAAARDASRGVREILTGSGSAEGRR